MVSRLDDWRVVRGMALLDEKATGWEAKIDLKRLDVASPYSCVLGQMYGFYGDGLEALGIQGFACTYGFGASGASGGYPTLTRAWKRAIRARLADQAQTGQAEAR